MYDTDLMSLSEAALLYGRSRMAFVWLVESGRIPVTMIGKRKFVRRPDVEELIRNRDSKEFRNSYITPVKRHA